MVVDCNQLAITLLKQITTDYSQPQLGIHFNCTCDRIDNEQQIATFEDADKESFSVHYDRLVARTGQDRELEIRSHGNMAVAIIPSMPSATRWKLSQPKRPS